MKYLEYNSGSEPIPIEQIVLPFLLDRDSISMTVCVVRRFHRLEWWQGELWNVFLCRLHSEVFAPALLVRVFICLQEVLQGLSEMWKSTFSSIVVICEKDPTLRRGFLNPFLSSHDNNSLVTFRSILTTLSDYCTHGTSGISTVTESSFTFHYAIPADVLRYVGAVASPVGELPSYHLDNRSLSIFSEHGTMRQLQSVDSQTNLLRSVIYRSNPLEPKERKVVPRSASHDILPLVIVMWDSMEEESAENTQLQSASRGRNSPTQLRELMKESEATSEEKMRLFIRPRSESRRSVDGSGRRNYEKPRFASILVIHFLRNRTPTLIRRLNICPDGIYVPRVSEGIKTEV